MSKQQLEDAISGKGKLKLENISFKPIVYGQTESKDPNTNKTQFKPIAFPYDAVKGNPKIKTANFDKQQQQFEELINSNEFKSLSANDRYEFLKQTFNIK